MRVSLLRILYPLPRDLLLRAQQAAEQAKHVMFLLSLTESDSVPNEALLSDAETATLPGEPVIATAQHISGVALLLGHSCQPFYHNGAFWKSNRHESWHCHD